MQKINCWEFMNCGRETGGRKESELGTCPSALEERLHGLNYGVNGGRICWAVEGTLCGGKIQDNYSRKVELCLQCGFYRRVCFEEGGKNVRPVTLFA